MMHPVVELAKNAVEEYIRTGRTIPVPETLTPEMKERAGVFVCLKKDGQLRGCIGTFMPVFSNVAEEVIRNAICAASQDPRFFPVAEKELASMEYSVDILSAPERVYDMKDLDPKKYGVIVAKSGMRGLLLPDIEGVDTIEEQLSIAKTKAGIGPREDADIYRFEVKRYR
jgi:AmmeMemoRadiSam system protein A